MVGLSDSITLSFMIVGHTKFSPDSWFGLLKQVFRRKYVQSVQEMADVVSNSAECNITEVIGREDENSYVPTYDWCSYFAANMSKITGIK